jgi:two-component system, cell cycle sensor histidine kinase and response regulator CckA
MKCRVSSEGRMTARPVPRPHAAPATVLIVEDERALLSLTQRVLERAGYAVVACTEPLDALGWWSDPRHRRTIDLVLTDVVMPGISGREMIKRMRATEPAVPVLMMTGNIDEDRVNTADAREALLTKPFTPTELLAAVRAALGAADPRGEGERAKG